MTERRLQVFVSSTFEDLREERKAAVQAILEAGQIPAGMEYFMAGDVPPWDLIERWITESDVYMLLAGGRYGSVRPGGKKSYTQHEMELAHRLGKPSFRILSSKAYLDRMVANATLDDKCEDFQNAEAFRRLASKGNTVFHFDTPETVKTLTLRALQPIISNPAIPGWARVIPNGAPPLLFPNTYQVGHGYLPDVENKHNQDAVSGMVLDTSSSCLCIGSPYLRYWLEPDIAPRLNTFLEKTTSIRVELALYDVIESADAHYDQHRMDFARRAQDIEGQHGGRMIFKMVDRKTDLSYVTYPLSSDGGIHCRAMIGFQSPRYDKRPFLEFIYEAAEPPPLVKAVENMHLEAFRGP